LRRGRERAPRPTVQRWTADGRLCEFARNSRSTTNSGGATGWKIRPPRTPAIRLRPIDTFRGKPPTQTTSAVAPLRSPPMNPPDQPISPARPPVRPLLRGRLCRVHDTSIISDLLQRRRGQRLSPRGTSVFCFLRSIQLWYAHTPIRGFMNPPTGFGSVTGCVGVLDMPGLHRARVRR